MSDLIVEAVSGRAALAYLGDLSTLRVAVFREYPYLYVGTPENEARYLRGYATSERSVIVIARRGVQVVGASTAMPMLEHGDDLAPTLAEAGIDPRGVYYFGESVLQPEHRGQGIGHLFFDHREAHARMHGFRIAAFCAVVRPEDHPARPSNYIPHDAFWLKRGYTPRKDIVGQLSWRDVGELQSDHREHPAQQRCETTKPMMFWIKDLQA